MSKKVTHELGVKCPGCGYSMEFHTAIGEDLENRGPEWNDLNVCLNCTQWNKYDSKLQLVELTEEERSSMDPILLQQMTSLSKRIQVEIGKKLN